MTFRGTLAVLVVLAACHGDKKPTTVGGTGSGTGSAVVAATPQGIVISDGAIGPIDTATPATLDALRTKLAGFDVKAVRDENDQLQYDAYQNGKLVLSVTEDHGQVLNVLTSDPTVTVASHPAWHVGAMFSEAKALSRCGCWGGKLVCWKDGEHVAASFERGCQKPQDDPHALVVLDGTAIVKLVWNPKPFGVIAGGNGSKPTGQGLGGTVKPVEKGHDDDDDDDDE